MAHSIPGHLAADSFGFSEELKMPDPKQALIEQVKRLKEATKRAAPTESEKPEAQREQEKRAS